LFVDWLLGSNNALLVLFRIVFDLTLIGWFYAWWRNFNAINEPPAAPWTPKQKLIIVSLQWLTYLIPTAGLVLELVGYGRLALYWFISWGLSIVVILWSDIIFLLLQETRRHLKTPSSAGTEPATQPGHPIRWLILQVAWLVWAGATAALLMISWGGKQAVIVNFLTLLTTPVTIGKISISVMSFVSAFLILVLTHTLARLWRSFLKDKILADSGIEIGLQDSITMITVYSLWVFGILFSLHALGFGTTSLAVGFGALGIGLGFGLQNIFNNFISGIILLIERPIQVGDDVEVNGVWATVKKINVRATVVQTYDNASLIIPNSEFISQQVTNWSFKDKRLRRHIDVGVAYGSDIELVRETLLEIAKKSPHALKQPKAEIIFKDFADSALLFRLRVWTIVEKIFRTETDIRFEIDRLFKERGIVIAFPQRDVHLFVDKKDQEWISAEKPGEPVHQEGNLPFNENHKQEPK
jgi:small-conductance mechanosensitive channel